MILTTLIALPLFASGSDSLADRWPGWRGAGSGVAVGSPPVSWSETENVRWKAPIPGKGTSCPVVWGGHVFVTSAVPTGKKAEPAAEDSAEGERGPGRGRGRSMEPIVEQEFVVFAFDRSNGDVLWKASASTQMPHEGTHRDGSYASPTIVTDGELVIASFGSYGVHAYDFAGKLVWQKDLGDMEVVRSFGEGSSPVLHKDALILNWDHQGDSFIVALNKKTGDELWRTPRDTGTTWVSPVLIEGEGGAQVVVCAAPAIAYSVESGKEVWSFGRGGAPADEQRSGVIASPVVHEDVLLFSTGTRESGSFHAVRFTGATGDLTTESDAALWSHDGDTPRIPSPIVYDGILYAMKSSSGLLSAFDAASGQRLYGPERMEGVANAYASPVAADGRLYFVGRDGTAEVVATGPEFETLAVNTLDDEFDASPAIAGHELFLRGRSHVYCIAAD